MRITVSVFVVSLAVVTLLRRCLLGVCAKIRFVKMFAGQTLRVLVTARLCAAAEEIFALFERTIAEYEEELRLCKEKQRRREQLETLRPRVMLLRADAQRPSRSPGLDLDQKIPETPQIKEEPEEQRIKQEEEQLPEILRPVPESVSVKTEESRVDCMQKEESSLLQQTELRDKSRTEDFITQTLGTSSDTDNDEAWGAPLSCSVKRTTGQNLDLSSKHTSTAETSASVNTANVSRNGQKAQRNEGNGHQCPICEKILKDRYKLKRHISVHAGERPFSCSICGKTFTQNYVLQAHIRIHTGEKPYTCSICNKSFTQSSALFKHKVTHMEEKPFSCSVCKKWFSFESALKVHMRTHQEKITFSCSNCERTFSSQINLDTHEHTHTDEKTGFLTCKKRSKTKPVEKRFSCCVCNKSFPLHSRLVAHMITHSGKKPFSCKICKRAYARKSALNVHNRKHTGEKPYSCSICSKSYSFKSSLDSHYVFHETEQNKTHMRKHSAVQSQTE